MNIRFFNATILTMKEEDSLVYNGQVWIQGDTIAFLGTQEEAKKELEKETQKESEKKYLNDDKQKMKWDKEIDCQGNLLMPGFKNAHTHSPMTCLRSMADDLPLKQWLEEIIFPFEAMLTNEDMITCTKLAILEYLSSGITGIFDMYFAPQSVAAACEQLGMRCVLVGAMNDFVQSIDEIKQNFIDFNKKDSLISYRLGVHAEYTTKKELLEQLALLAKKYEEPVFCHLCETQQEVEDCLLRTKMTPVAYLNSLGLFDYGGGGYHCVYISNEELEIMKEKKIAVITNPASNLKLASGMAPIELFLQNGLTVGIGTDGPASNNCLDMFREMFLVTGIAKVVSNSAKAVSAKEVLRMATVSGSQIMGLTDCDILAIGKKADMIMIDLQQPNMQPLNHIENNIVYSGSKANIKMTMINGNILFYDGIYYVNEQPQAIYKQVNNIIKRIQKGLTFY